MTQFNITLIGCGKMGTAMTQGWIKANLIKRAEILDPFGIDDSLSSHPDLFHVKLMESITFDNSDMIILAVKPQIMDELCIDLAKIRPQSLPILSIAAGKNTTYFQSIFGDDAPIIRVMPNTPAAIGKGMSALYATKNTTQQQKDIATSLLNAVGETLWINDEDQMDAVTAVSGSGPAYLFHMIEVMAQAGEEIGLSQETANKLARQTIIGAAALADEHSDISPSTLRQNVTSPGGTTEAALNILMNGDFQKVMSKTIAKANRRGKELAN